MRGLPPVSKKLVTIRQAIEARPWLTERYARRLVFERRVTYYRVGGRVLLDLADVDRLVEEGRVEAVG